MAVSTTGRVEDEEIIVITQNEESLLVEVELADARDRLVVAYHPDLCYYKAES
jgi:hypothetical protein